ncbi:phycocyanin subunit beta [Chlorogloeopsis sp. ULAP02]|uniref:phycocyanin subunit beta n=1 Tax=Chlorogloeopsis sp. ULAP02 TaxID=3107926 RepID=UPI00398A5F2D
MEFDYIITGKFKYSEWFFIQDLSDISQSNLSVVPPDKFLSGRSSFDNFVLGINEASKLLEFVNIIVSNAGKIIADSANILFIKHSQVFELDSNPYAESQMAACLHDMEIILRYVSYAMFLHDSSVIDGCLNGLCENYQSLGISYDLVIAAIQLMEKTTINIVNESISIAPPNDYSSLIFELSGYFEQVAAALT